MKGIVVALMIGLPTCRTIEPTGVADSCESGMFRALPDTTGALLELASDPSVLRARLVEPDLDALARSETLDLNLFEDVCLTAARKSLEVASPTSLVWSGHIQGVSESSVILSRQEDALVGAVTLPPKFYQVRVLSSGLHAVAELDPKALPPEAPPVPPGTTSTVPR